MPNDETMRDNVVNLIAKLANYSPKDENIAQSGVRAEAVSRLLSALARYDDVHSSDEWDDDDD